MCVRRKGAISRCLILTHFTHPGAFSIAVCLPNPHLDQMKNKTILFFSETPLKRANPSALLKLLLATLFPLYPTLSIFAFLFFTALSLFRALLFFSLYSRSLPRGVTCKSIGVCVCVRARAGDCDRECTCVFRECGVVEKNGAPGLLRGQSGSA